MTYTKLIDPNPGSTQASLKSRVPEEWVEQLEQVMQQDRDFFLQHPDRDYYIRPITPVELVEGKAMGKAPLPQAFVLVGQIAPGSRIRLVFEDERLPPIEEFKQVQQQIRKNLSLTSPTLKTELKQQSKARPKAKGFG